MHFLAYSGAGPNASRAPIATCIGVAGGRAGSRPLRNSEWLGRSLLASLVRSESLCSSCFPSGILSHKGRKAVGNGHHKAEGIH